MPQRYEVRSPRGGIRALLAAAAPGGGSTGRASCGRGAYGPSGHRATISSSTIEHMFAKGVRLSTRSEQAAVLALVKNTRGDWYGTADIIETARSALRVVEGDWTGFEPDEVRESSLVGSVSADQLAEFGAMVDEYEKRGIRLLTVLDHDYPKNLRLVYNRPPFLWLRGGLLPTDDRAIAVVGTRTASPIGLEQAWSLATQLAERGVTVISGLALGIDGAAHEGSLGCRQDGRRDGDGDQHDLSQAAQRAC